MSRTTSTDTLPYRPEHPNEFWLAGVAGFRRGLRRTQSGLAYPGNRWEWEAGWDYEAAFYSQEARDVK